MNFFIIAYFYVYERRFPGAMYCTIIKVDFAALAASTRFSPRTSIWNELTDERFNNFVILYAKPMLQITGHIIQTTYLSRIPSPTMFSPDHITRIKFLLFILIWFIWFISLALIIIIIIEVSIFVIVIVYVFNIRQIKVFIFSGLITFALSICFNILQSSQKASIEHSEQIRSLRTILWPSNLAEFKAMMPSILQYYLEFANLFWNHPTFSTMKKPNLPLVN